MRLYMLIVVLFVFAPTRSLAQLNLQQIGHLAYPNASLAGCWHYKTDAGSSYALVGTSRGMSVVNLDNPSAPTEVQFIPMPPNNWRELRTYQHYVYVVTEAPNAGVYIADLSGLPDSLPYRVWTGDSAVLRAHTVGVEGDRLYLYGGSPLSGGAVICSLDDPWNPEILGKYTEFYVHDGYVRQDTLWAAEIYKGQFSVVDIKNPENPILCLSQPTPGAFTHNIELSADRKIAFSTDELPNSPLTSYDVSDLMNIRVLDRYFPSQKPEREVHNVRVHGRFLVNPSYGGQLTIVDAYHPDNLVEVAWAVVGTSLVWDADPYLSDTLIFATAKNEGFFVFKPTYSHAAWIRGAVRDAITGKPIPKAKVAMSAAALQTETDALGYFKSGTALYGNHDLWVSHPDYLAVKTRKVVMQADSTVWVDVELFPAYTTGTSHVLEKNSTLPKPTSPFFSERITWSLPETESDTWEVSRAVLWDARGVLVRKKNQVRDLDGLESLPTGLYFLVLEKKSGVRAAWKLLKT